MNTLIYGLLTGILFGFLLQRGQVLRYDKQLGALRFLDMTIVKFMLSSVLVGMAGVYFLKDLAWQPFQSNRPFSGATFLAASYSALAGHCSATVPGLLSEQWGKADGTACGEFSACSPARRFTRRPIPA